jgi:ELWxxDGT repeat protein
MRNALALLSLLASVSLSAQTPYLVKDINSAASSSPTVLTAAGNMLFFYAADGMTPIPGGTGMALWRTDGSAAGTVKLRDMGVTTPALTPAGPYVLFTDSGKTLFRSDGTVQGTAPADDLALRFGGFKIGAFFPFGDTLFTGVVDIRTNPADPHSSLWKTTAVPNAPAVRLGSASPRFLMDVAGHTMFIGTEPQNFSLFSLWTTDGTPEGTYAVIPDLGSFFAAPGPSDFANAEGTLFFLKNLHEEGVGIWKSEGTFDGTTKIESLAGGGSFYELATAGRMLFYVWNGLWTTDGTPSTAVKVVAANFARNSDSRYLVAVGNRVVFVQSNSTNTYELWGSDGTPAGTRLLLALGASTPELRSFDGLVYFAGSDTQHGTELWVTDGTAAGTRMLADVNLGLASSAPANFTRAGNLLYFSATTAAGRELWALPLTAPVLSINDTRAAEGDTADGTLHFTVSLAPAAAQTVAVDYATADGTALAGEDYDAASGTLTFAPGETSKTIDVRVRGDVLTENNETLYVTLSNARGARLLKSEGGGIIDDDDQLADISVAPRFEGAGTVTVSNSGGPRSATEIAVNTTATPAYDSFGCSPCFIAQLVPGQSAATAVAFGAPAKQVYLSATATARQRDPQPSNNAVAWTVDASGTIAMDAAFLIPGATATITMSTTTPPPPITSSDSSVVSVGTVTKGNGSRISFPVTGLKPGSTAIGIAGQQPSLKVDVVASGTTPRWPGGVEIRTDFSANVASFEKPLTVFATATGTAPISGAKATGTIVVTAEGQELGNRAVGSNTASLASFPKHIGNIPYTIAYSGDANFLPQTVSGTVLVFPGLATLNATMQPVPGAPGTFALTVEAVGSPVTPPGGTLSVFNGFTEIAKLQLVAASTFSAAKTTLTNLPESPSLRVSYPGDANYAASSGQVRLGAPPRSRSARH